MRKSQAPRGGAPLLAAIAAAVLAGCGGGGATTVGGTVTGLVTGTAVTLQINGKETLAVAANGAFEFHDMLNANQNYDVRVVVQPSRANCLVDNASGHVDRNATKVTNVNVTCAPAYTIGGVVAGLPANTSVVLANGTDTATYSANGPFVLPTALRTGGTYAVTVTTQPTGATCNVTQGSGTVQASDVTDIVVSCS
jgi:hypothetical protein